jgi:hypothetical protein
VLYPEVRIPSLFQHSDKSSSLLRTSPRLPLRVLRGRGADVINIVANCSRRPSVLGGFVDGNVALVRIVIY